MYKLIINEPVKLFYFALFYLSFFFACFYFYFHFYYFVILGDYAWTAESSDFGQYLIVDLGQVMRINQVATQGRRHSNEYVEEYSISYGSNGFDYTEYKESAGNVKV